MIGALTALLGGMIFPALPDDCNLPAWTFCVMLPDEASAQIQFNGPDFIVYGFDAADGSTLHVYVGSAPQVEADESWAWGRLGTSQTRSRVSDSGRTDYLLNRPWGDVAPNWIHAWTEPSPTGNFSGADALATSLQSCPLINCPDPGPDPVAPRRIERLQFELPPTPVH